MHTHTPCTPAFSSGQLLMILDQELERKTGSEILWNIAPPSDVEVIRFKAGMEIMWEEGGMHILDAACF